MEHLVPLWLAAVLGGLVARRLGVPGGTLLGALLAMQLGPRCSSDASWPSSA